MNKVLIYFLAVLLLLGSSEAFDFDLNVGSIPRDLYEGESTSVYGQVTADSSNVCDMKCTWQLEGGNNGYVEDNNPIDKGDQGEFEVLVVASGSKGIYNKKLTINCDPVLSITCWSGLVDSVSHNKNIYFSFSYLGDGKCDLNNGEDCTKDNQESACACSSPKSCINDKGDQNRGYDSKKCATYCGNKVVEKQYEKCETCPTDVGKCDGEYCNSKNECEGDYCVHNVCSHIAYRIEDGFCDSNVNENCGNSLIDCRCGPYEDCFSGVCKTWCGNGVCEASEKGVCKADCLWCGDGICDEGKETCRGCSQDCGECEKTEEEEQSTQQLKQMREETKVSVQKVQSNKKVINSAVGGTLGAIFLILSIWFIIKLIKSKKEKPKKKSKKSKRKVTKKNVCPKCKSKIKKNAKFCGECGKKLR